MKQCKLGDICDIKSGGTPSRSNNSFFGGSIPWAKISDITKAGTYIFETEERITEEGLDDIGNRLFSKDTLLFSMYGSLGKTAITGIPMSTNQAILGIKPDKNLLNLKYLKYWCDYKQDGFIYSANGVALKNLSATKVKNFKISLPSLQVQQQIVEILDEASKLYGFQKNRYKKIKELRDSIFYKMFGNPITNDKKWKLFTGKEYAKDISVGVVVKPASYYVEAGIPALRSQNINPMQIDTSNMVYFSEKDSDNKLSKSKLNYRDVVLVRTGLPGTAAVVPKDMDGINCIDIVIVRPRVKILNPTYFAAFMNSSGGKDMVLKNKRGQIQKHLNVGALRKTKIPVPDIELQDEFESILDYLVLTQEEMLKATGISKKLFNSLLQKAFNGELL